MSKTNADLAAQVAQLRTELDALRDDLFQMSTEIRTHRLIIDDHEGNELATVDDAGVVTRSLTVVDDARRERITTVCDDRRTMLTVSVDDVDNELGGHGLPIAATVYVEAELDPKGFRGGDPCAIAQVQCSTCDDSFAIMEQRSTIGEHRGRRTVTDRGELRLHQQRWQGCFKDGAMSVASSSIVKVGSDGVTEETVRGKVIAYSPLQRAVR